jgi:hypothetical protein
MTEDIISSPIDISHKRQKTVWIILYVMASITVLLGIIRPIYFRMCGLEWSKVLAVYVHRDIVEITTVAFWFACLTFVLRVRNAMNFIFLTALWSLALQSHAFAMVIYGLISHFFPSSIIHFLFKEIPVWQGVASLFSYGLRFSFALLAAYIIYSTPNQTSLSNPSHFNRTEKIFGAGVVIIFLIILVRWIGVMLLPEAYDSITIATSVILLCTTIMIMVSQFFSSRYFLSATAISMSFAAIFLPVVANFVAIFRQVESGYLHASSLQPISSMSGLTFLMWTPMLLIGILALLKEKSPIKIRAAGFVVPVCLASLAISSNCWLLSAKIYSSTKSSAERPPDWPGMLMPIEGASKIRYTWGKTSGIKIIEFQISEAYPADRVINIISDRLKKAGFEKLDYSLLNPDTPFSGWGEFSRPPDKPRMKGYSWQVDWLNKDDTAAMISLEYRGSKSGTEDLKTLYVAINLHPPVGWPKERIGTYKRRHPPKGNNTEDEPK